VREPIPLACSLPAGELADRRLEFADASAKILSREPTERGLLLRFRDAPGFQQQLADLIRRERECCPFFEFRMEAADEQILLEVGAPPEARPLVEGLFSMDAS
jgi:hypothetical protein